jgi:hypothetical protein
MTTDTSHPEKLRVIVAGGGVAALEAALALGELAGEQTDVSVVAPNTEFVYRPLAVREPFAYGRARRYPLAQIVRDAGATLMSDALAWVDHAEQIAHTEAGEQIAYDALVLALGAKAHPRYPHALTIDDSRLEETFGGLIQDIEGGYVHPRFAASRSWGTTSSAWTPTGGSPPWGRSTRQETHSTSPSSTAGSPPSRRTPPPCRSRRSPEPRSRPSRSTPSSTACS